MKSKLYIIRSFPGSGKTTFANKMFPNILKIENDQFHYRNGEYCFNAKKQEQAIQWCIDSALLAMSKGMDLCISNTFTKKRYIDSYLKFAKDFGYDVEIYRMMGNFENIHGLDNKMVSKFKDAIEDYENESYVYPIPNKVGEYRITNLKVGDKIMAPKLLKGDDVVDENGDHGIITKIECLGNGNLRVDYKTEANLFCSEDLKWIDAKFLKKIG